MDKILIFTDSPPPESVWFLYTREHFDIYGQPLMLYAVEDHINI